MKKPYEIQKSNCATRPFIVIATFRSFNRVVGQYHSIEQAKKAAYYRNKNTTIKVQNV